MPNKCVIALGANLHSTTSAPVETLRLSLKLFKDESVNVAAVSQWYQTPAFPVGSGPDFVNAAAILETDLPPEQLLLEMARIEAELGRKRKDRWGARVCDLDLIAYGDSVLPDAETFKAWHFMPLETQMRETPKELILPHPRLQDRAFVLVPMRDVVPDWVHPVTGRSLDEMITDLPPEDVASIVKM